MDAILINSLLIKVMNCLVCDSEDIYSHLQVYSTDICRSAHICYHTGGKLFCEEHRPLCEICLDDAVILIDLNPEGRGSIILCWDCFEEANFQKILCECKVCGRWHHSYYPSCAEFNVMLKDPGYD